MNKDQIQELMMGVAVVALGYALYKHFKPGAAVATKAAAVSTASAGGPAFAYGASSPFTSMKDLLTGTVHDFGEYQGENYLADMESSAPVYGNGPRVPGGYW